MRFAGAMMKDDTVEHKKSTVFRKQTFWKSKETCDAVQNEWNEVVMKNAISDCDGVRAYPENFGAKRN